MKSVLLALLAAACAPAALAQGAPTPTPTPVPAGQGGFALSQSFEDLMIAASEFVPIGADEAEPAAGVLESIAEADAVLLAPSNPVVSIGSVLQNPSISYSQMAKAYGMYSEGPIENPKDLAGAYQRALAKVRNGEPAMVDVISQPR